MANTRQCCCCLSSYFVFFSSSSLLRLLFFSNVLFNQWMSRYCPIHPTISTTFPSFHPNPSLLSYLLYSSLLLISLRLSLSCFLPSSHLYILPSLLASLFTAFSLSLLLHFSPPLPVSTSPPPYCSLRAATPGSTLPSSSSRDALRVCVGMGVGVIECECGCTQ